MSGLVNDSQPSRTLFLVPRGLSKLSKTFCLLSSRVHHFTKDVIFVTCKQRHILLRYISRKKTVTEMLSDRKKNDYRTNRTAVEQNRIICAEVKKSTSSARCVKYLERTNRWNQSLSHCTLSPFFQS